MARRTLIGGSMLGLLAVRACVGCPPQARMIAGPVSFPEGPCYIDGRLYFVEYGAGNINTWDGSRTRQLWSEEGSGPCAVLALEPGELLVTCYDKPRPRLIRIRDGKTVETISTDCCGEPFDGPNDLTRAPAGGVQRRCRVAR